MSTLASSTPGSSFRAWATELGVIESWYVSRLSRGRLTIGSLLLSRNLCPNITTKTRPGCQALSRVGVNQAYAHSIRGDNWHTTPGVHSGWYNVPDQTVAMLNRNRI